MKLNISAFLCSLFLVGYIEAGQNGLKTLMEGNDRYVHDKLEHLNRNLERREAVVSSQEPFAVIVGCADSRVPPEIIFDQGVGDLFVVRVAGNVIGPIELDSIKYSAIYLHSSVILVLGHENCGAINAVLQGTVEDVQSVAKLIEPAVQEVRKQGHGDELKQAIKINALMMRDLLLKDPSIQKLVSENKLEVHAGFYDLQTGAVKLLSEFEK